MDFISPHSVAASVPLTHIVIIINEKRVYSSRVIPIMYYLQPVIHIRFASPRLSPPAVKCSH